jgi:hypothetical protein
MVLDLRDNSIDSTTPLRCDACGRFISYEDLQEGYAVRRLVYPDSHFTTEEYETLCAKHK